MLLYQHVVNTHDARPALVRLDEYHAIFVSIVGNVHQTSNRGGKPESPKSECCIIPEDISEFG